MSTPTGRKGTTDSQIQNLPLSTPEGAAIKRAFRASLPRCAIIIRPDGSSEALDHKPDYDEAKGIIGGYLEIAHGSDEHGRFQLIVDEDGLSKGLPHNGVATRIYRVSEIVGTAILLRGWRWT